MHGLHIVSFASAGKGGERRLVGAVLSQRSKLPEGPPTCKTTLLTTGVTYYDNNTS